MSEAPVAGRPKKKPWGPLDAINKRWRPFRRKILPYFTYAASRALAATFRWRVRGFKEADELETGVIFCSWHGRSFVPAHFLRNRGIWAMFSLSRDGQMQSRLFEMLGYKSIRGSTGRGGDRAAIEAIRLLRKGERLAITPDGPRGPNREVQGGVLLMAKKSGAALVPMGSSASPSWIMKAWDHYLVPKPFARVTLRFGEPLFIAPDAGDPEIEAVRVKLGSAMTELEGEGS